LTDVCIVTGGAGFIGCAVSEGLANAFDRVIAIDNLHPQIHALQERPGALDTRVELVVADVTVPETWDSLLADVKPNVVVHLAAETGTGQSLTEGSRHALVNVAGTTQMLDAFARHSALPSRIVLTSSRAVYGEGAWQDSITGAVTYPGQRSKVMLDQKIWEFPGLRCLPFQADTTQVKPTSIYGATKLAQEHIILSWALSFGVETAILRLQNVYGPGQSLNNPYTGIVSLFSRIAREKKIIPVYEDGEIIRDFVFIDDVAEAIRLASVNGTKTNMAYDVGQGTPTSILELARLIAEIYGAPEPAINGMYRNGDVRHASCVIDRTKIDLRWKPEWDVKRGVTTLCTWIEEKLSC
jgi:dTDP-L-rhamnose 4-epimerase